MRFPVASLALASFALLTAAAAPASAQYNLYYGNFHAHSNLSDDAQGPNSGSPATAFQYARDVANLDIMALTDHSHYLSASEYSSLLAAADSWTTNGVFVALGAQEHGSLSSSVPGAFGHINIWEASGVLNQNTFRYNLGATYGFISTNVNRWDGGPLAASFNHPYSSAGAGNDAQFANFAFDAAGEDGMRFIEVLNGARSSSYESEYFEALGKGWKVGALGNQDNHQGEWGNRVNNAGNIPLTGVWATALTKSDVLQALRDRRTFAMEVEPESDRMSLKLIADGTNWMGSEYTTAADSVSFEIEVSANTNIGSIQLYRNGTFLKSIGVGSTFFTWNTFDTPGPGDFYYVAKINQSDGDAAWSSPIWIESTSNFSLPISTVKQNDANGFPALWFQTRSVQGIVTAGTDELSTTDNKVFIQDATGGTMVQEFGVQSVTLNRGDNVLVTGFIDTFQGQTFISSPSAIEVQSTGAPPDPVVITTNEAATNAEDYEGSLVEIRDVEITAGTWPMPGFSGSVTIDDGSGPFTLFIDQNTDVDEAGAPVDPFFSLRGIVTQQDINSPYDCCHVVFPRDANDLFQLQGVGVEIPSHHAALRTELDPAFPNPFENETSIQFRLAGAGEEKVQIAIYDVNGRRVKTLLDERMIPGTYEVQWDGRDQSQRKVAAGVYFTRLVTRTKDISQKVLLVR